MSKTVQQRPSVLFSSRPYRFVFGLVLGFIVGAILVLVFSGISSPAWIGSVVLSSMTFSGFALILFGYFYKRKGVKTFSSDFLLGFGIGLILVWFVGAGNGTLTLTDISY